MNPPEKHVVHTISEVCDMMKCERHAITKEIQEGRLKAFKIGNRWRIHQTSLDTWIEAQYKRTSANG